MFWHGRLLAVIVFSCFSLARAEVWRHVDQDGVLTFSTVREHPNSELVWLRNQSRAAQAPRSDGKLHFDADQARRALEAVERSRRYAEVKSELEWAASVYGVDYALIKAVVIAESGFNPQAVSHKGAVGLMQLMPATAARYGVHAGYGKTAVQHLMEPALNIAAGTRHLADLMRTFNGRLDLALAAYNAGEGAVKRSGYRIPNYRETQAYVVKVMALYDYQKKRGH